MLGALRVEIVSARSALRGGHGGDRGDGLNAESAEAAEFSQKLPGVLGALRVEIVSARSATAPPTHPRPRTLRQHSPACSAGSAFETVSARSALQGGHGGDRGHGFNAESAEAADVF